MHRLLRFDVGSGPRIGVVQDGLVWALPPKDSSPATMTQLCALPRDGVERAIAAALAGEAIPLERTRVLAPIDANRDVIAVGRNYRDHAREFSDSGFDASERAVLPPAPVFFSKRWTSIIGPDDEIELRHDPSRTTDYEGELAVVIGRVTRNVQEQDALAGVFGWTLLNDVTARELQREHVQWFVGKSPDTYCPTGPTILLHHQDFEYRNVTLETRVNGQLRQRLPCSQMVFGVEQLIASLSRVMTLHPGDVIATGTGLGVGIGFDPPRFLERGDVVEVSAKEIGVLRNAVV